VYPNDAGWQEGLFPEDGRKMAGDFVDLPAKAMRKC
jgi:hypothetical protein